MRVMNKRHHAQNDAAYQVSTPMLMNTMTKLRMALDRWSSDLHNFLKMVLVIMISHSVLMHAAIGTTWQQGDIKSGFSSCAHRALLAS